MSRIFGLDIGTTSIGFAVIDHEPDTAKGRILRLGVRIFPEARDPDGTPLNHQRRQARMRRRQLRRRRQRRRRLGEILHEVGFLPACESQDWPEVMKADPYDLRARARDETEILAPCEFGRALYHLAQRRHFRGRDLEEDDGFSDAGVDDRKVENAEEKQARAHRESTQSALRDAQRDDPNATLGAWLSKRGPHERKRGRHATRTVVEDEFEKIWTAQAKHHQALQDPQFKETVKDAVFAQRPVFWRKNTLRECRFMPGKELCPKGSWLSQQRRMLEKLNNLEVVFGESRPLNEDERAKILEKLQTQVSMKWGGVRAALKPLYRERGESGAEKGLKFNLELGGEKLIGNPLEKKLADIFGDAWQEHPHKQAIRDTVPARLWSANYGEVGKEPDRPQRVVILPQAERDERRKTAACRFVDEFGVSKQQADALAAMKLPSGWEPYSIEALRALLPKLEAGARFGALVNGAEWESWRNDTFPERTGPTGAMLDRLPSPADREERDHIARLRNPTVVRTRNELRKVVNNLIDMFGKPDRIRVEVARDVGRSKREREEIQSGIRRQEERRNKAKKDLRDKGIPEPSRDHMEKWLLWKESRERCPYTGDPISFAALFHENEFDVEHIWPRSRSLDDSFRNKTLCRKSVNQEKGSRTPFEYIGHDEDRWAEVMARLDKMRVSRGGDGMPSGKIKRFLARSIPDDFANRQLSDTGYAAREAVAFLKRLWPDVGPDAPVTVQPVSGRVTAQLRKYWNLNNILGGNGEKTRADHRHHAIDALVVACADPGVTQQLSRYWQARERPGVERPGLSPPWKAVRADAERAVADVVVSHRVRKKVSGSLHKETTYGNTRKDVTTQSGTYRQFVTRKSVEALSTSKLAEIRDARVRDIVTQWIKGHGGDPKRAFPPYPRRSSGGPEIRKVRILKTQQLNLMARVATGYSDLGDNHHIAIFRLPNCKIVFEVVSLFEAARRLAKRKPVVKQERDDGARFIMSLSPGDALEFPDGTDNKAGIRIVQGVWASGQVVTQDHIDAAGSSIWRPKANSIVKKGARKLSIDPIGRLRPAND